MKKLILLLIVSLVVGLWASQSYDADVGADGYGVESPALSVAPQADGSGDCLVSHEMVSDILLVPEWPDCKTGRIVPPDITRSGGNAKHSASTTFLLKRHRRPNYG